MIAVEIDPSLATPLHEQVAAEIRGALAKGECRPGERLPPARDLAAVLGVNRNTVLRALRDLRGEGLLEFRRGRCITVSTAAAEHSVVLEKAHELVGLARRYGYGQSEIIAMIEDLA